ncbi:MAG: PilZ domain-containing protein [Gammaproteobacteria bacterium]
MLGIFNRGKFKDRRVKSVRNSVEARVNISHSHFGTLYALSRDISDTGMFVLLNEIPNLPKGAHVRVQLPESANPDIIFNMRVVRTTREGVALVFVDYELDGKRFKMEKLIKALGKIAGKNSGSRK